MLLLLEKFVNKGHSYALKKVVRGSVVKTTLETVERAEADAEKIRIKAEEDARAAVERAKADAEALQQKELAGAKEEAARQKTAADKENEAFLKRSMEAVDAEIQALKKVAAGKEKGAVSMVLAELV